MIWGLSLILVSVLAVPSLILSKKPDAKELLAKIEPYQGWIGVVGCVWGVWGVISAILNIKLLSVVPIWWIIWLAGCVVMAVLGFMLGYGMLNDMLFSKSEEAKEKAAEIRAKIAPMKGKFGIVGIIVGVLMVVIDIIY